nr:hypothetical protein [Tanacetum cinerariifolium]
MSTSDTIPNDPTITPDHPLYLHQTDHPSLILISKKLTGSDNYGSWRRSMMIDLNAKSKYRIATGEYPKPSVTSNTRALWERNNDMIISWILNVVSEQISNNMNFKLKGFWDELDSLEAPHMCVCPCSRENGRENIQRDQRKRLIAFLMGLDEGYSNIRGKILLMNPLPTVVKAYGMKNYTRGESSTPAKKISAFKKGVYYGNCSKEGHTKAECYKIVRYPIGHPLYGKFLVKQPPKSANDTRNYREVHMVMGQNIQMAMGQNEKMEVPPPQINFAPDSHVFARMDQLQTQLNQVFMMLQNNKEPYAGPGPEVCSWQPL